MSLTAQQVADKLDAMQPWGNLADDWAAEHCRKAAALVRENLILRWSTDLPTAPGVYWYREPARHERLNKPLVVTVWESRMGLYVSTGAMPTYTVVEFARAGSEWAGPIQEPDESL